MSDPSRPGNWTVFAAMGAGAFASACCTLPVALVALGAAGSWVSTFRALAPFRTAFVVLAVGFLGLAVFQHIRARADCTCNGPSRRRNLISRVVLLVGIVGTGLLIASPRLVGHDAGNRGWETIQARGDLQRVVLRVSGMNCQACDRTVMNALIRLEGVHAAHVSYDPPEAVVHFEPGKVSIAEMTEATTRAGYPSVLESGK